MGFRTASTGLEAAEAFKAELVELLFSPEARDRAMWWGSWVGDSVIG